MPFPCRVNSHMPCRAPVFLRQCRVLRESPRGRRKYPNCIWDWYASGNNLRGTPRGSRKKPNAGRSPTCRLWTADANSQIPCRSHAALSLSERHGRGMAWERTGRGMACVKQTRPHCVNPIGKTQSKPLMERHGMCVRKISPPSGFDPRTVQPVVSRYTDWATGPTLNTVLAFNYNSSPCSNKMA
jgi:hypothetical protein